MNLEDILTLLLIEEAKDKALVPAEPVKTYERRRESYIQARKTAIVKTLVEASR